VTWRDRARRHRARAPGGGALRRVAEEMFSSAAAGREGKIFFFFDERGKEIGGPVKPQPAAGRTSETNL